MKHFERKVRLHTDGLNEDVQVTNERLGQLELAHIDTNSKLGRLETTQIATNTKLAALETSIAGINTNLATLLRRFDDLNAGGENQRQEDNNTDGDHGEDNFDDEYSADTEHGDREARLRQRLHCNHECMNRRRDVQNNDDAFGKIKFNIPPFDGKYDPNAYITWEIVVDQKFTCHEFSKNKRV